MTMTALADPTLRRTLTAMVRRRVSDADAEDVVQTVLCDALAASRVPTDPTELRRWISGIARHKVADLHRRARREGGASSGEEASEAPAAPPPFEAREILGGVMREAGSPRDRQTMEWLVREHSGEPLSDLAGEAGLPQPAVRQRVSRMRRALRARWGGLLALLLAGGGALAYARGALIEREAPAIAAEPAAGEIPAGVAGSWRVERIELATGSGPADAERALASLDASGAVVDLHGTRAEVRTRTRTLLREITVAPTPGADGTWSLTVRDPSSDRVTTGTARLDGDRLLVTLPSGTATFSRR